MRRCDPRARRRPDARHPPRAHGRGDRAAARRDRGAGGIARPGRRPTSTAATLGGRAGQRPPGERSTVPAKTGIPGVSVAILWDDGRSWAGASGLRDVSREPTRSTTGTAFAFASVSKTLTAAVVLQLVDEGTV